MILENLNIEITRKCNSECIHCLRGANNYDSAYLSWDIVVMLSRLLSNHTIEVLTITGGEPSLAYDRIGHIINTFESNNIKVNNFYIVTNGKWNSELNTKGFIDNIERLYNFCSTNDISEVAISDDTYHASTGRNNLVVELLKLDYAHKRSFTGTVINEGFAKYNDIGVTNVSPHLYTFNKIKECLYVYGCIYINIKGRILSNPDLSYDSQTMDRYIVSDVTRLRDQGNRIDVRLFTSYNDKLKGEHGITK